MRTIIVSHMGLDPGGRPKLHLELGNAAPPAGPRRVPSEALLGTTGELVIVHGGREYRLRITQNGKLILTA